MNNIRLLELRATTFGSIRDESISFQNLNVFIGANGSGKSTILDALRFLLEGLMDRDFARAARRRGGGRYLFGMWDDRADSALSLVFKDTDTDRQYEWSLKFSVNERHLSVDENATELHGDGDEVRLLSATNGAGWWMSGNRRKVQFEQRPTTCVLGYAAADVDFPGRYMCRFIDDWRFIDPNFSFIRRRWRSDGSDRLDFDGGNLLERLYQLYESDRERFTRIFLATNAVLGMPDDLTPTVETDGRYHLRFYEKGLKKPVSQRSVSAGTLRILTLMTALHEDPHCGFVGIEEPENNVHPFALNDFMQHLVDASQRVQLAITTHSPMLLDHLGDPESICVVRRDDVVGTKVVREQNAEGVKAALEASGFGLGEFYETKGFGQ